MQTLDIISVNLWQILISLANLVLLFLILKKFLFKPVKNILAKREAEIREQYDAAARAEQSATENETAWNEKIQGAKAEANAILQSAADSAKAREQKILAAAHAEAESIVAGARQEAALERKKAEAGIRQEIVEVSGALAEKLLAREISVEDHRVMIDDFIGQLDEGDHHE